MKKATMNWKRLEQIALACMAAAFGCSATLHAVELYTMDTEEPEPHQPELVVSYVEPDFDTGSSQPQFAQDYGIEDSSGINLERFYWENSEDGDWRIYLDSRWLSLPDEIRVRFEMHNNESVFFDLEFNQWKEYDYGSGVWYPPTDTFALLPLATLEEEINKIDLSLRLHTTDTVRLILGYGFFNRDGQSLSTRFGDDFQYRIGGTPSRGIIPALYDGEETVHRVDARIERQDGVDRAGLRLHYQRREVDRQHVVERAASQPSANRYTTSEEKSTDDLFSASAYVRQELNDTVYGSIGFVYTRLDGDITGSRIFGSAPEAAYDIDFAGLQLEDRGFLDLDSRRRLKQWVMNGNLVYTPSEDFRWMGGVRMEHLSTELFGSYLDTYSTVDWAAAAFQVEEADMLSSSEKSALDISGFIEGRYTGFEHVLFYSRVEVSQQSGDLEESWSRRETFPDERNAVDLLDRLTDFDRSVAFWEAGVNYYPKAGLRISLAGYLKYRENNYDWMEISLPGADYTLYPGYIRTQKLKIADFNARVHARLMDSLRSVTRFDIQDTTIESENRVHTAIDSAERRRLVFNQSLTWTPSSRFFLTGTFNYVEDLTESPAADLEGTFAGIVQNLPNDYWQANAHLYIVLTKLVDLQLGYQYLEMSNFIDTSPATVLYGSDLEQHHGSVQFILHLSEMARARIGYDIYDREEPSAGGMRDYTVNMLNGSLQVIF